MSIDLILSSYNQWQDEEQKDNYIDMLETFVEKCNETMRDGKELVPDAIYDNCIEYLRALKPDSYLLHQTWSEDGTFVELDNYDIWLSKSPMVSIQTLKSLEDDFLTAFINKLPLGETCVIASVKENGHGIRIVYDNGVLVKARSRGRSTSGKDLTRQIKAVLGETNEALQGLGIVEIRAEMLLPFYNLDKAKEFNPDIKSAFSGVASMSRESGTEDEFKLLKVIAYDFLTLNRKFTSLSEKFGFMQECGFDVPLYKLYYINRYNMHNKINSIMDEMDAMTDDYAFYTDGVVLGIDDLNLFENFGYEDKFKLGNMALKIGKWEQNMYSGVVKHINWINGKTKKTPVVELEEGVITATGNTVTNIPIYAPCYIMIMKAYKGNIIHFRYGGEAGVIPCLPDGRLITDKTI